VASDQNKVKRERLELDKAKFEEEQAQNRRQMIRALAMLNAYFTLIIVAAHNEFAYEMLNRPLTCGFMVILAYFGPIFRGDNQKSPDNKNHGKNGAFPARS
jgi:uncharacterized membrane protein (DUF485 family)